MRRHDLPGSVRPHDVFTLIILQRVSGFGGLGSVGPHDVVVQQGSGPEEAEAAWGTQHAAEHVLRALLQPVADGVLEPLVPHHGTWRTGR